MFYNYNLRSLPFKNWVNTNCLIIERLSSNPSFTPFLVNNPKLISWPDLCKNESDGAIVLLSRNLSEIHWSNLCANKNRFAIALIEKYSHAYANQFDLYELSKNPSAIPFLMSNRQFIDMNGLCENPSPLAITLIETLEAEGHEISIRVVQNPMALKYVSYYYTKFINNMLNHYDEHTFWYYLHLNTQPYALNLIIQFPSKIRWDLLSSNNGNMAIQAFIEANAELVVWEDFLKTDLGEKALRLNPHLISLTSEVNFEYICESEKAIDLIARINPQLLLDNCCFLQWDIVSTYKCIMNNM